MRTREIFSKRAAAPGGGAGSTMAVRISSGASRVVPFDTKSSAIASSRAPRGLSIRRSAS